MEVINKNEKIVDISQTVITWLDELQSRIYNPKDINNYLKDLKNYRRNKK